MLDMHKSADVDDTLGGRIVLAREAMNLTTAQLARRMGVQSKTLANWERDRVEPRTNRLVNLAGILNVSPTWLISGYGTSPDEVNAEAELNHLRTELDRMKELHREMGESILTVESAIHRLARSTPEE